MSAETIAALLTTAGAIIIAFFTWRGAARTAQPSAQEALNAGFTALTERQLGELLELRDDVAKLERKLDDVERRDVTRQRRLDDVERRLAGVSDQLSLSQRVIGAAVSFIDRLVEWGQAGGGDPMPIPPEELHVHLNHPRWRAPNIGET